MRNNQNLPEAEMHKCATYLILVPYQKKMIKEYLEHHFERDPDDGLARDCLHADGCMKPFRETSVTGLDEGIND